MKTVFIDLIDKLVTIENEVFYNLFTKKFIKI